MPTKAHKAAGARLCRALAFAWASFAPKAFAFDSPLQSVAWHQLDILARASVVIGCVVIPAVMLCVLAAGGRKERRLGLAMLGVLALLWGSYAQLAGTVWYVRPDTQGEYGAEDGTSLENAFDGNADISWASIGNGDTVVYCGDWTPADARLTFTVKTAALGSPVLITGDAALCGRASNSTVDRTGTTGASSRAMAGSGVAHYIIEHFTLRGCGQYCLSWDTSGGDPTLASNVEIRNMRFEDCGNGTDSPGDCIWGRGTGWSVHDNVFDGCSEDCLWHDGAQITVYGNVFRNVSFGGANGDCVQLTGRTDGAMVYDNDCDHSQVDSKQCFIMGTPVDSPNFAVFGNRCRLPIGATVSNAFYIDATGGQSIITRNWSVGGNQGATFVGGNNQITSNVFTDATARGINLGTGITGANVWNNTISRVATGITSSKAGTTVDIRNNAISATTAACIEKGGPTNGEDYNNLHDCGANTVARGGAPETPGASDILADPQFIGGPNPTTAEGFRPSATSPLVGAGTDVGSVQDFFGDTYYSSPDIGAFRRDSCYRRSRDGKLDMARTRSQVVSRCLGVPGRYPEGL